MVVLPIHLRWLRRYPFRLLDPAAVFLYPSWVDPSFHFSSLSVVFNVWLASDPFHGLYLRGCSVWIQLCPLCAIYEPDLGSQ